MIPLPSELILPFAGFLISDPEPDRADHRPAVELLDRGRRGDHRQHARARSSPTRIGAWGGRPFLERYGRYLLIRDARDRGRGPSSSRKYGAATVFFGRLLPIVRTFISFPAGVTRMPIGKFILFSTARRAAVVDRPRLRRDAAGRELGGRSASSCKPFDLAILVGVIVLFVALLLWWRLGMPGLRRKRDARPSRAARRGRHRAPRTRAASSGRAGGPCR